MTPTQGLDYHRRAIQLFAQSQSQASALLVCSGFRRTGEDLACATISIPAPEFFPPDVLVWADPEPSDSGLCRIFVNPEAVLRSNSFQVALLLKGAVILGFNQSGQLRTLNELSDHCLSLEREMRTIVIDCLTAWLSQATERDDMTRATQIDGVHRYFMANLSGALKRSLPVLVTKDNAAHWKDELRFMYFPVNDCKKALARAAITRIHEFENSDDSHILVAMPLPTI